MDIWNSIKTVLRDFVNSSSINGVGLISNATSNWAKFAWSIVILLGFFTAIRLINSSFVSWNESPFISTAETLPISKAPFPVVTVCPPKGTNTALNPDIMAAQNVTLGNKTRIEAFEKAKSTIYEPILIEHVNDNLYWAEEEECAKEIIMGNMEINDKLLGGTVSWNDGEVIELTGTRGCVGTPRFNAVFDRQRYRKNIDLTYTITISKLVPQNAIVILELSYNTMSVFGDLAFEHIQIRYGINKTSLDCQQRDFLRPARNLPDCLHFGLPNVILRYKNQKLPDFENKIAITYRRISNDNLQLDNLTTIIFNMNTSNWDNKRETGFKLKWRFEDHDRKPLTVQNLAVYQETNIQFRSWMKLFYYLKTRKGLVNDNVADAIKTAKFNQFEQRRQFDHFPSESRRIEMWKLITKEFSVEESEITNVLLTNVTNTTEMQGQWIFALEMYLIISYNPNKVKSFRTINFFDKLLKNASPPMVAQALLFSLNGINQLNSDLTKKENDKFIHVIGDLYQTLDPIFDWRLGKVDIALSSKLALLRYFESQQFVKHKEEIQRCLDGNTCDGVSDTLQSLSKDRYKISEISNHPVHIINQEDQMNPSAFIPFCQFGNRAIGTKIKQFTVKVCTGFTPTILEDQLCYSLDVNDIGYSKENQIINEENALILLLDYNIERSTQIDDNTDRANVKSSEPQILEAKKVTDGYCYQKKVTAERMAKVHLNSLQEFYNLGGRRYEMSSVKSMRTTSEFDKYEENIKKCQNKHSQQECFKHNLLTYTLTQCACIPFHLMTVEKMDKIDLPLCNPIGMECYERYVPSSEQSCLKECEGMYYVVHVNTNNRTLALEGQSNQKFQTLFEEYLQFKRAYETKFDNFYVDIRSRDRCGWPFINEQAVFVPKTSGSCPKVEQRLEIIQIYFATPTLDIVTRDARTNFVTKISMIGGMLGLFTGFSVMSGIEVMYFTIKIFLRIYQN